VISGLFNFSSLNLGTEELSSAITIVEASTDFSTAFVLPVAQERIPMLIVIMVEELDTRNVLYLGKGVEDFQ